MDRVAVFPDGDLNIEAVSTSRASAAFARPVSAGALPQQPLHGALGTLMPRGLCLGADLSKCLGLCCLVAAVQGGGAAQPPYPMHMPQGLVNLGQVRGGAPSGSSRLPANSRSSERVVQILNRLQSLTPAEIDRVRCHLKRRVAMGCDSHVLRQQGRGGQATNLLRLLLLLAG